MRTLPIITIIGVTLSSITVHAALQDLMLSTDFEAGSGQTGTSFTLGESPNLATFTGGESKSLGNFSLYHSGFNSWLVRGNAGRSGTNGTVDFETPADILEFYAKAEAGFNATVTAVDSNNAILASVNLTTSFQNIRWTAADLGDSISKVQLNNLNGGVNDYAVIDDFGFTPVPEPSSVLLIAGGIGLLGVRRRK